MVTASHAAVDSVKIDLLDTLMAGVTQTMTNISGMYSFADVGGGNYFVSLIEPTGYTVANNPRRITVTASETTVVNFELVKVTSDTCGRWRGYWRHQFMAWIKGLESQESFWDLLKYIYEIVVKYFDRFPMFRGMNGLAHWENVFNPDHCTTVKQHGISHLGALLMNIVSHKCEKRAIATKDGKTYWDVAVHASNLLSDTDASNDALALEIASAANEGREIEQGIVPSVDGTTDVEDVVDAQLPGSFALLGNFPNPFNPQTMIRYQLAAAANVEVSVYDMLGREVSVLVNKQQEPGQYTVTFDGTGLPSGMYLCRLTAGQFSDTKKMLLTK
jgi:hypothetical protein